MFTRVVVVLFTLAVAFAILGADVRPMFTAASSARESVAPGGEMFGQYCAACHGRDGKGDGPAASAFKAPVADLTRLSERNNGSFPEARVYASIVGTPQMPAAHGSKDTPIWGDGFQSISRGDGATAQMRLANLTAYIRSLQAR